MIKVASDHHLDQLLKCYSWFPPNADERAFRGHIGPQIARRKRRDPAEPIRRVSPYSVIKTVPGVSGCAESSLHQQPDKACHRAGALQTLQCSLAVISGTELCGSVFRNLRSSGRARTERQGKQRPSGYAAARAEARISSSFLMASFVQSLVVSACHGFFSS